ncbi:TetR/AcrR family transcriptional regulator [Actinokineospora sp. G85]|uniref:TetR/AcrR family transcriptional regulator n=1 Tax=Actinokineospora sp. G85 TaxID=3406626 RepID=UPI003C70ABB4
MARAREFDVDTACESAMELFRRRGYEGTSVSDLVEHVGVGRASLYGAFGPKHQLYLAALERYVRNTNARVVEELGRGGSPLESVRLLVERYIDEMVADPAAGCLVVGSAAELLPGDAQVASLVARSWDALEMALVLALSRARAVGELSAGSDPGELAQFLLAFLQGLRVLGKDDGGGRRLRGAAAAALRLLAAA